MNQPGSGGSGNEDGAAVGRQDIDDDDEFLDLRAFAGRHRATVRPATHQDFEYLAAHLGDGEKEELGSTWRGDWRAELQATENNALHALVGSIEGVEGFLLFGATRFAGNVCLIWMLKTASFADSARKLLGHRISFLLRGGVEIYTSILLRKDDAVFNTIAKKHTGNIRWLRQQKLDFHDSPLAAYEDFLMFGRGRVMPAVASSARAWKALLG